LILPLFYFWLTSKALLRRAYGQPFLCPTVRVRRSVMLEPREANNTRGRFPSLKSIEKFSLTLLYSLQFWTLMKIAWRVLYYLGTFDMCSTCFFPLRQQTTTRTSIPKNKNTLCNMNENLFSSVRNLSMSVCITCSFVYFFSGHAKLTSSSGATIRSPFRQRREWQQSFSEQ
jgi:hypothetical protein